MCGFGEIQQEHANVWIRCGENRLYFFSILKAFGKHKGHPAIITRTLFTSPRRHSHVNEFVPSENENPERLTIYSVIPLKDNTKCLRPIESDWKRPFRSTEILICFYVYCRPFNSAHVKYESNFFFFFFIYRYRIFSMTDSYFRKSLKSFLTLQLKLSE